MLARGRQPQRREQCDRAGQSAAPRRARARRPAERRAATAWPRAPRARPRVRAPARYPGACHRHRETGSIRSSLTSRTGGSRSLGTCSQEGAAIANHLMRNSKPPSPTRSATLQSDIVRRRRMASDFFRANYSNRRTSASASARRFQRRSRCIKIPVGSAKHRVIAAAQSGGARKKSPSSVQRHQIGKRISQPSHFRQLKSRDTVNPRSAVPSPRKRPSIEGAMPGTCRAPMFESHPGPNRRSRR